MKELDNILEKLDNHEMSVSEAKKLILEIFYIF